MGQDMSAEEEELFHYRHKVEVHMGLIVVNLAGPNQTRFALQSNNGQLDSLPCLTHKAGDRISDTAKRLFKKATGSDSDWFVLKQVGVVDHESANRDSVVVLYAVTIPEIVPLINNRLRWVTYEELSDHPNLVELMGLACNYHRIN